MKNQLKEFLNFYSIDNKIEQIEYNGNNIIPDLLKKLVENFGGYSFNNGLYRICNGDKIDLYTQLAEQYFPKLKNSIIVFAYDWLGRFFAINKKSFDSKTPLILLIEPGAGDALEIPSNLINFHNFVLIEHANDALAVSFFKEWKCINNSKINNQECIGYKIPLFLGGLDEVENLELIDMEIYFNLCSQLWNQTLTMKKDQKISEIKIK